MDGMRVADKATVDRGATLVARRVTTAITLAVAEARQQRNSEHDAASATSLVPACGKLQWQPLLQTAEATTSRHRTRRNSGSRKPRQMTSTASLRGNATDTAAVSAITTPMLRLRMNQRSRVDLQSRNQQRNIKQQQQHTTTQQQRLAAASRQQQQRAWTSIDKGKNKKQSVQSKTQVVGSSHWQSAAVSSSQQQSASAFQHQQLSASSSASADQHHQDQLQRFSTSSSASLQRQQFSTASAAQHQQFSVGSIEHQRQQFSIASAVRRQQFSISSI